MNEIYEGYKDVNEFWLEYCKTRIELDNGDLISSDPIASRLEGFSSYFEN